MIASCPPYCECPCGESGTLYRDAERACLLHAPPVLKVSADLTDGCPSVAIS